MGKISFFPLPFLISNTPPVNFLAFRVDNNTQDPPKEEFSDWPHGLLAIGTFGNNVLKGKAQPQKSPEYPSSSEDAVNFTPEEVGELQKELTKLLSRKPISNLEKEIAELPLDKFLNCPSSLEVDRRNCDRPVVDCKEHRSSSTDADIERRISVILGKCKEVCPENGKKGIGKRFLSFLLKKMFICSSGFSPVPGLRDPLPPSTMEKLLRTMLHKKLHTRNSSQESSAKKYIEEAQMRSSREEDEAQEKANDGCKWVKTDSEYIVLEI